MELTSSSSSSLDKGDAAVKVAVFLLVQVLVYLILSKSSDLFSASSLVRSISFRPLRSASISHILAGIFDVPAGDDSSGSPTMMEAYWSTAQD